MKELQLSAARARMVRGETQYNRSSRFIEEIPRYLLNYRGSGKASSLAPGRSYGTGLQRGTRLTFEPSGRTAAAHGTAGEPSPRYPSAASRPVRQFDGGSLAPLDYEVGDTVLHAKFGTGLVTAIVKGGRDYEVTVDFPNAGTKKMLAGFARLKKQD